MSKMLKIFCRAPRSYRAGERLNFEGVHVFLESPGKEPEEIDRSECTFDPPDGTLLTMSENEELKEITVTVSYQSKTPGKIKVLTAFFTVTVRNEFKRLSALVSTKNIIAGAEIPISGLIAVFDSKDVKLPDPISYFSQQYLTPGNNVLTAQYTALNVTKTISVRIDNVPAPSITGLTAKYEGGDIYPGQTYDTTKLSAEWRNSLADLANYDKSYSISGVYPYSSGNLSVERHTIADKSQQQVKMWLLSNPNVYCWFTVGLISRISELSLPSTYNMIGGWDGENLIFESNLSTEAVLRDELGNESKITSEDVLSVTPMKDWDTFEVPHGLSMKTIQESVYVTRKYPSGSATVSSTFTISAYRKPIEIRADVYKSEFIEREPFDPGEGAVFTVLYSNDDAEYFSTDEVEFTPSVGTILQLSDEIFSFKHSEAISAMGVTDVVQVNGQGSIQVMAPLVDEIEVISPDDSNPFTGFFVGDSLENRLSCPAILSVRYVNGVTATVAVSDFMESEIDTFEFSPISASLGLSSAYGTWTRTVNGYGRSIKDFEYPVIVDYNISGACLSIVGTPTVTNYYEGQYFNPEGLSFVMVFGNNYEMDVTEAVIDNLSSENLPVPGDGHVKLKYVLSSLYDEKEYNAFVDVTVVPKILYEMMTGSDEPRVQARINPEWVSGSGIPLNDVHVSDTWKFDGIEYPVVRLASGGFAGCSDMTSIGLPLYLEEIGESCFMDCTYLGFGMSNYIELNYTRTIGASAFANCTHLRGVMLPVSSDFSRVEDYAFYNSGIEAVYLPDNVVHIGNCAFANCSNLTSVDISPALDTIGESAFVGCFELPEIDLHRTNLATIPKDCFSGCNSLTQVDFNPDLVSIGTSAFYGCGSLESILLPGVTTLGEGAFMDCPSIDTFRFETSEPNLNIGKGALAFTGMPSTGQPEELIIFFFNLTYDDIDKAYANQIKEDEWTEKYSYWTGFADPNADHLKDTTFTYNLQFVFEDDPENEDSKIIVGADTEFLTSAIVIPPQVRIENKLFWVTGIGDEVFKDMDFITDVFISPYLVSIGNNAFDGCTNLSLVQEYGDWLDSETSQSEEEPEDDERSFPREGEEDEPEESEDVPPEDAEPSENAPEDGDDEGGEGTEKIAPTLMISTIGSNAFSNTKLSSIELPQLKYMGRGAFENTQLTGMNIVDVSVPIGSQINSWSEWQPFKGCGNLQTLSVGCWQLPIGNLTNSPESILDMTIVGDGDREDDLNSTTLVDEAVVGCTSMSSVSMSGITEFGENVFEGCGGLREIPAIYSEASVKPGTFNGLSLEECVTDEDGSMVFHIPEAMIDDDGTLSLTDTMLSILPYALNNTYGLRHLIIPEILDDDGNAINRYIASNAVFKTSVLSLTIEARDFAKIVDGDGNIRYPQGMFPENLDLEYLNTSLTCAAIPDMLIGCSNLMSVDINPWVDDSTGFSRETITIGEKAFRNLSGLKEITLAAADVSLNDKCFDGAGLTSFIVESTNLCATGAYILPKGISRIKIPINLYMVEKTETGDVIKTGKIVFDKLFVPEAGANSPDFISVNCFGSLLDDMLGNARTTKDIVLMDVTGLGKNALLGLTNLSSVQFVSDTGTYPYYFGTGAFQGCIGLSQLTIEHGINNLSIGYNCFAGDNNLVNITMNTPCPVAFKSDGTSDTSSTFRDNGAFNFGASGQVSVMVDSTYANDWSANFKKNFNDETGNVVFPLYWPTETSAMMFVNGGNIENYVGENDMWVVLDAGVSEVSVTENNSNEVTVYGRMYEDRLIVKKSSAADNTSNPSIYNIKVATDNEFGSIVVQSNSEPEPEEE